MGDTAERQTPFDERAALEELERLRRGIEHYRLERKAVGDRFEAFVGSFNKAPDVQLAPVKPVAPTTTAAIAAPVPEPLSAAGTPSLESSPSAEPPLSPLTPGSNAALPVATVAPPTEPTMDALTARLRGIPSDAWATPSARSTTAEEVDAQPAASAAASRTPRLIVLASLVVVLVAVLAWSLWPRGAAPSVHPEAPRETAPAAIPAPPPVPPAATPAVAAPVEVPVAEVITTRAVWLRVIVDGERVLERQLPADTRVPLKGEKTIVIRTGDAGAVRMSIGGKDQGPLGKDGQVVNRSFIIPAKSER